MNLAAVKTWSAAHKTELLAGGAGVAVLFGLRARSKAGTSSSSTTASTTTAPGSTAPMPSYAGSGYDSSSSDVYNAIQPQIEQTQAMLQKLLDLGNTPSSTPPPVDVVPVNALPDAPLPERVTPVPAVYNAIYQGVDGIINHAVSGPVQQTPYANGNLLYTDAARPWLGTIQTSDTPANRVGIVRDGGVIVGGY